MRLKIATFVFAVLLVPALLFASGPQATRNKSVTQLLTEIKYAIDEDNYFDDTELTAYVNQAVNDISWQTGCLDSSEAIVLDAGTSQYTLSGTTGWLRINRVIYQSGATDFAALLRSSTRFLGSMDENQAHPKYWYEVDGRIGFFPLRDIDTSGTTITVTGNTAYVYYTPLNLDLSGASKIPTPAALDTAIIFYAAAKCFFRDQQWQSYTQAWQSYLTWIQWYRMTFIDFRKESFEAVLKGQ